MFQVLWIMTKLQEMEKRFFSDITKAVFHERPNRFIVICNIGGRTVRAYLPNPGRLWELFFPGTILYLTKRAESYKGSTDYTVVAVERDHKPIMLHTHVNNLVARSLIEEGSVPGLEGAIVVKPEVTIGNSRFDFLLVKDGRQIVTEVKSCTLVGDRIAMFPDAVTARGTKHLLELADITESGTQGAFALFIIHWPGAEYFLPEWHTDLEFSRTLFAVKDIVSIRAVAVEWNSHLAPTRSHPVEIPWHMVDHEAHDSGSYIFIMRLTRDRKLLIGGLGEVRFRKGYYLYVGSAKMSLSKRIERHRRIIKKHHWHIDSLREAAEYHAALPVRASDDLECGIASALGKVAEWSVPGFGSSDCGCGSHLFGMTDDPLHDRAFIRLLMYFRIDRLEKYLRPCPVGT
jgi:sugar fermentation stimulation protein A